jgi:hypothetical protein
MAHWKLDETSGSTAYDSADGFDGTLVNGPVWTAGQINGALSFDGTQAVYINGSAGYGSPLNIYNTNMTISAWIKPGPSACTIIARAKPNYTTYRLYITEGKVGINTYKSPVHWDLLTGEILDPNNWYHIVGVLDRDNDTGIIYVNGIEQARSTQMITDPPSCDAPTKIGCRNNTGDYAFTGLIDDVRIYNYALNANEVAGLYDEGTPILQSISIAGPNSVPEESDTQYQVIGYYDNGSSKNITADANLAVAPDEFAQIDSNGLLTTDRLYRMQELCTIKADCKGFSDSKLVTIYPLCDGNQCTPMQLAKRDIADVIKIKKDVMDDLKYAMKIERVSSQLLAQADSDKKCRGFNRNQFTKARIQILAALMWEQWANGKIDASVDSLEDALRNLQEPPVEKPKHQGTGIKN